MSAVPPLAGATFLPHELGLCRVGTGPSVDAIDHAANLLLVHAKSLADSVCISGIPDWQNEPDAKNAYDELVDAANALRVVGARILVI